MMERGTKWLSDTVPLHDLDETSLSAGGWLVWALSTADATMWHRLLINALPHALQGIFTWKYGFLEARYNQSYTHYPRRSTKPAFLGALGNKMPSANVVPLKIHPWRSMYRPLCHTFHRALLCIKPKDSRSRFAVKLRGVKYATAQMLKFFTNKKGFPCRKKMISFVPFKLICVTVLRAYWQPYVMRASIMCWGRLTR